MKTRKGFVSNSSSTSFIIVGVSSDYRNVDSRIKDLVKADKPDLENGWGGGSDGTTLQFLGGEWDWDEEDADKQRESYEPYFVGIPAEEGLKADKRVSDLKKEFIAKAKALGVNYTEDEVELYYGEVSSE